MYGRVANNSKVRPAKADFFGNDISVNREQYPCDHLQDALEKKISDLNYRQSYVGPFLRLA